MASPVPEEVSDFVNTEIMKRRGQPVWRTARELKVEVKEKFGVDMSTKSIRSRAQRRRDGGAPKRKVFTYYSHADNFVTSALSQLERIEDKDPGRMGALLRIKAYVDKEIERKIK